MSDINWNQRRSVINSVDGDLYVKVGLDSFMEVDDYINGGRSWSRNDLDDIGIYLKPDTERVMTNAEIQHLDM